MPKVEFYAGAWSHYVDHLAPIYKALPATVRGDLYVRRDCTSEKRAKQLGLPTEKFRHFRSDEIVLVASYEDYRAVKPAKVIFLNHGVGQTYGGDEKGRNSSSYSGGAHRGERTILFLGPSHRDAMANQDVYPDIPSVAIGVPYLDRFHGRKHQLTGPVAISFHGNIHTCPETRWAWPWARAAIQELSTMGFNLLGHAHPRAVQQLRPWYASLGIPFEPSFQRVLDIASCYVIDNSSSGYEAAAIGIPTVWLNPPHYRKNVHHGLRFWEAIPGIEVDDPIFLQAAIEISLKDPFYLRSKRDAALSIAYADADERSLIDGHATERAVAAICQTLGLATLHSPSSNSSQTV